jgi:hypothetical protein
MGIRKIECLIGHLQALGEHFMCHEVRAERPHAAERERDLGGFAHMGTCSPTTDEQLLGSRVARGAHWDLS